MRADGRDTIEGPVPRTRRVIAVTCIALVVFGAFLPLGGLALEWLIVTPLFTLLLPITTAVIPREAPTGDEPSVSLLATLESRGPPARSSLT